MMLISLNRFSIQLIRQNHRICFPSQTSIFASFDLTNNSSSCFFKKNDPNSWMLHLPLQNLSFENILPNKSPLRLFNDDLFPMMMMTPLPLFSDEFLDRCC
jgi:hypothetical protein